MINSCDNYLDTYRPRPRRVSGCKLTSWTATTKRASSSPTPRCVPCPSTSTTRCANGTTRSRRPAPSETGSYFCAGPKTVPGGGPKNPEAVERGSRGGKRGRKARAGGSDPRRGGPRSNDTQPMYVPARPLGSASFAAWRARLRCRPGTPLSRPTPELMALPITAKHGSVWERLGAFR